MTLWLDESLGGQKKGKPRIKCHPTVTCGHKRESNRQMSKKKTPSCFLSSLDEHRKRRIILTHYRRESSLRHHCCTIKGFPLPNDGFSRSEPRAKLIWHGNESRCHLMMASQRRGGQTLSERSESSHYFLTSFHVGSRVPNQTRHTPQSVQSIESAEN